MRSKFKAIIEGAYTANLIDSYQMHFLLGALDDDFAFADPETFFRLAMKREPKR
jgi:hypothetical protein